MNDLIIDKLSKAAKQSTNRYKRDALRNGVRIIQSLDFEITSPEQLIGVPYIGTGIRSRVAEILQTGTLAELTEESELSTIIGIGKSKIKELAAKNITTVKQLKDAVKAKRVKLTRAQKLGLKYHGLVQGHIPRTEVSQIEKILQAQAKTLGLHVIICGSYRRGRETSNDIDVILYADDVQYPAQLEDPKTSHYLSQYVTHLFDQGLMLDTLNEDYQTLYMGFCRLGSNPVRRIDIRWVPTNSLAFATLYFTGPYELNQYMRSIAKKKGMLLNEHGLWTLKTVKGHEIKIANPMTTEKEIFEALGMKYLEPTERERFNTNTRKP